MSHLKPFSIKLLPDLSSTHRSALGLYDLPLAFMVVTHSQVGGGMVLQTAVSAPIGLPTNFGRTVKNNQSGNHTDQG